MNEALPTTTVFECVPLHQLHPAAGDGCWQSEGDDPQFCATLPAPLIEAGWYRITARLRANEAISPAIYLDLGEGWSGQTYRAMRCDGGNTWHLVEPLPAGFRRLRFDPCESAARFGFDVGDLVIECTSAAEEVLALVARDAECAPAFAARRRPGEPPRRARCGLRK